MRKLSIEERMTVCNMSIEAGARAGLISPDEKTIDYLFGKRYVPIGEEFTNLAEEWRALATDKDAVYDQTVTIRGEEVEPQVSWGDRKSTRLNSSHVAISYAVFCLKKKNKI